MRLVVYAAVIIGGRMSLKGDPDETRYLALRAIFGFMGTASSYTSFR